MKKEKVLVLGLGSSGKAAVRFYCSQGKKVVVADTREVPAGLAQFSEEFDFKFVSQRHDSALLEGVGAIVISPGLSPFYSEFAPLLREAEQRNIEVLGEIEVFARELLRLKKERGYEPKIIGITGTNGKTTTTNLAALMVHAAGKTVCMAGNVGPNALTELGKLLEKDALPQYWVLELSSFQLATTGSLHCDSAALLNVTEDHLDWHGSLQEYAKAKMRIFRPDTVRVLNAADPMSMEAAQGVQPSLIRTFSIQKPVKAGSFGIFDGELAFIPPQSVSSAPECIFPLDKLQIFGEHNVENALAAAALVMSAGIGEEAVRKVLSGYKGEKHRIQPVVKSSGITYFDDSKGTNVGATAAAVRTMPQGRLVIILGGDGKGQDFTPLAQALKGTAKACVFIGRDGPAIAKAVRSEELKSAFAATMQEAVRKARSFAREGDVILLSPACASWDMFKDYADRAAQFTDEARRIEREEASC